MAAGWSAESSDSSIELEENECIAGRFRVGKVIGSVSTRLTCWYLYHCDVQGSFGVVREAFDQVPPHVPPQSACNA